MKVTRDVIYDLLPAYFAGEASADTRALIDEFFTTDPEFGRMAERFRRLHKEPVSDAGSDMGTERLTFDRAKTRLKERQAAAMWAVGAAIAFAVAFLSMLLVTPNVRHPGIIIGLVFSGMALATWIRSGPSKT